MVVAVQNVVCLALVFAGVCLALPDGFFQIRHTGGVLGIDGHIVIPLVAVDGRGGQGEQEGIAGAGDHIRDLRFHDHVQAKRQAGHTAVTVLVRLRHGRAAVVRNQILHGVFQRRGIGEQRPAQSQIQRLRGKVIDPVGGVINVVIAEPQGGEKICGTVAALKAVQDHDGICSVALFPAVGGNVRQAEVGKLDALHRVTVSQVVGAAVVVDLRISQHIVDRLIVDPGGDIAAGVPYAVIGGAGHIVLVQGEGAGFGIVDGGGGNGGGVGGQRDRQHYDQHHDKSKDLAKFLH